MIWEYYTKTTESPIHGVDLNSYGNKGWELVQVVLLRTNQYHYIFKRPKE